MIDETQNKGPIRDNRLTEQFNVPPLSSIAVSALIVLLIFAFFKGYIYDFYASFLFLFYGLTKHMWVSVILLGVFQTLILIPFRVIRIWKSDNISEFQKSVEKMEHESFQRREFKDRFEVGSLTFLFYLFDFMVQLTTFLTIGRLFLTDFYQHPLSSDILYRFVPYPEYPIAHTFFKIPYPAITQTLDLGWRVLLPVWAAVLLLAGYYLYRRRKFSGEKSSSAWSRYAWAYIFIIMIALWFLVRHFPIGWELRIFSGDVSKPNQNLNTITAIVTFLTLLWFGAQKIIRKGKLAKEQGIDSRIINKTQQQMFSQSILDSALVGLGAYFVTNKIPSAFELSIFTLEIISLFSPLTLDRFIHRFKDRLQNPPEPSAAAPEMKSTT